MAGESARRSLMQLTLRIDLNGHANVRVFTKLSPASVNEDQTE